MQINSAKCARLKTAIAEEEGNIQGVSERFIAESDDYLIKRVPTGTYNTNAGENPRKIRYSTAPIADSEYVDLLTQGNENGTMNARDNCSGEDSEMQAVIDKRGAFGCNIPGSGISAGYDEFTRVLQGKAWETDPACVLDLILKEHYNPYIEMLRTDLPRRAKEQFEYSLQRNVIELARYNTSVVSGFTHSAGQFPAVPTGALDLGTIRRVFALLVAQGWTGAREVGPISHSAFETMRNNYKKAEGVELESTLDSSDTRFLDTGTSVVMWGGIKWVLTDTPLRGYLLPTASGNRFVPVRPTIARNGTGEGLVTDINNDYFDCTTWCNGTRYELFEVGFYVHPTACTREGFAVPQVAGKQYDNNMFNFMVRMLDGNDIDCNRDNFKFLFRILHAYAFESLWPERMGAVMYRVTPDCVNSVAPCCDTDCAPAPGNEVGISHPPAPVGNDCSNNDCDPAACDDDPVNTIAPVPTETDNCPDPDEGLILLSTCGPVITDTDSGQVCVYVRRQGGSLGAAQVNYATADGTAVDATDYTNTNGVLAWADGENDSKKVCIPILPGGAGAGAIFTLTLSGVVGADLADGVNGCATTQVIIESPCVPTP